MNPRKAVCLLAVLLFTFVPLTLAQGTYTQIDVPGQASTACFGINTVGDIVGSYSSGPGNGQGFLLSGGIYTTIDDPGEQYTALYGINDLGQVVGTGSLGGSSVGFVYALQTQTFTTVAYPGSSVSTTPTSINNEGTIGGYYRINNGNPRGFELIGSTYIRIAPPNQVMAYVQGVSGSGKLVGRSSNSHRQGGTFLYTQGKYKRLAIPNAPAAIVYGINPAGNALVGGYEPSPGLGAGFVYQNKTLQTLQFPGSNYTVASGINGSGVVTGYFFDSNNNAHGFTWTPPASEHQGQR